MIAAAVTGPMHSAIPPAGLIPTQNILLVHWNKAETDRLTRNLGDLYRLRPVRTETQLLTALEDPSIQLILINAEWDYRQDSIRICSRLKSLPAFAHIAVIFLIPAGDLDARIASLRSGADAWIERPLSPDYLRAQINALLTNRRRLKSYFTRPEPDPHPIATTLNDPSFLNRLRTMILRHLPDPDLNVDVLARLMNVSRPTLYRKLRSLSDRTPNEWVNLIRLNKAAELLSGTDRKVLEVAKMVGFHSRSNFGKAFLKHFGATPVEYRHKLHRKLSALE